MSGKHGNHAKASRQHRWKPGGIVCSTGHVKVRVGKGHPLSDPNGYAYEHLVVWVSAGNPRPQRGEHNRLHNAERGRCVQTGRLLSKSRAGHLLDGVAWRQFPEVR